MNVSVCLLNVDLTNDCLRHLAASDADRIIAGTNELVGLFRSTDRPILWVRQEFAPNLSDAFLEMRKRSIRAHIAGTAGAQLDPRLDVRAADVVMIKKRYSAFFGTGLDELLRKLGVDTLILTGVNTHACIRTTAIDAYQRDLEVIFASECLASYDEEHARISMRYMNGKIGHALTNGEKSASRTEFRTSAFQPARTITAYVHSTHCGH
jgi:nicotinamidase-related amidase